jgi:hypothetical protein
MTATLLETDIGGIELHGGYPSEESVALLYDELDFQRACQAYIWGTPAVEMQVMTEGLERDCGLSLTTVGIFEDFLDPKTLVATGNGQSIYALGNIDLGKTGPVVIETPANVLGFVMSGWQQPLEDLGPLGPDKGKGGRFLLLPPGQDANVPGGYFAVPSDTLLVSWVVRGYVKDGKRDAAVQAIKGMRIYRLIDHAKPPAMRFVNLSGKRATLLPVGDTLDGLAYFQKLAAFIQREPVREQDKQVLGMLAGLGIARDKAFAPDARTKAILEKAAHIGHAMTATLAYASRAPGKEKWPGSRWEELLITEHADFVGPDQIDLDARAALYYQAVGASKRAQLALVGVGSKYAATFKDQKGHWLNGEHAYHLHVPPDPPAKDFWSVTVYDAGTRSMIDTDQGRAGLGSYDALETNADGSVELYFGPQPPQSKARQANWVKTKPGAGFFLYFRWYGPLKAYFDGTWRLPDVERIDRV